MAGCINIIQEGYTGLETRGDVLWFNPSLPVEPGRISMQIHYRRHNLSVEIFPDMLKATACRAMEKPISIGHREKIYELEQGKTIEITIT